MKALYSIILILTFFQKLSPQHLSGFQIYQRLASFFIIEHQTALALEFKDCNIIYTRIISTPVFVDCFLSSGLKYAQHFNISQHIRIFSLYHTISNCIIAIRDWFIFYVNMKTIHIELLHLRILHETAENHFPSRLFRPDHNTCCSTIYHISNTGMDLSNHLISNIFFNFTRKCQIHSSIF